MSDVPNSIQFCLFASGGKISAPATTFVLGIGAKMSDVPNSIQFCLFASGGKISAPATRSLFTFPMNSTLNFPPLTGTHDTTRKTNLP